MCVYIVDDSPADSRMLIEGLRQAGLTYRAFGTGDQVLRALEDSANLPPAERPAAVVLDVNLPGRNGFEVLEAIRKHSRHRELPVTVLTTSDDPKDRRRSEELGATSFHTKPMDLDEWLRIIDEIRARISIK